MDIKLEVVILKDLNWSVKKLHLQQEITKSIHIVGSGMFYFLVVLVLFTIIIQNWKKLNLRAIKAIFYGYSFTQKEYQCYDSLTVRQYVTKDI